MSTKSTPWSLPDRTVEHADEADREIRMSDFVLMTLLIPVPWTPVRPPSTSPRC